MQRVDIVLRCRPGLTIVRTMTVPGGSGVMEPENLDRLTDYESVHLLARETRSLRILWSARGDAAYTASWSGASLELFMFQQEVRGAPRIMLRISKGMTVKTICEPTPHISSLPVGKILYFLAALWNYAAPLSARVHVPYRPETGEERDGEALRLALRELHVLCRDSEDAKT